MTPVTTPASADADLGARGAIRSLGELALDAAARRTGVALRSPGAAIGYPEFGALVTEIARGLIALGIEPGDRVAILGSTSAEWTLADYGALCAGAVVVPIYHTNSPEECEYVLTHSGSRLVFCENPPQAAKIAAVAAGCPEIEHVVLFEGATDAAMTLDELRVLGDGASVQAVHERVRSTAPGDMATIVYTSGTTGPPKGCMLTHANILATARMYATQLELDETHTLYQFLPLAHVLARVAQAVVIEAGACAVFWGGDASRIVDELATQRPTLFPSVPRIYEKIHAAVSGRVQDGPAVGRVLFTWALRRGARMRQAQRAGRQPGVLTRAQYTIADRLVLAKVRHIFGERLQLALVGAAPVARELLEFFDACGVLVLEGYGLSESCAAATLNTASALRFGTVGTPLPGTEIAIAQDGEIMIRGPQVFPGYYRDPEATAAALTEDGWLHTGDLGAIEDGFVAITGRKKDLIITSSGKNVTPVNIESALRDGRYVNEAVVFGDNHPYLVALLTLDPDQVGLLHDRLGIARDPATVAAHPAVRAAVQKEVDAVNARLARIEQIKRFAILDRDLTQAGGELTPTLKVKRATVYEKYAGIFAGLYEERTNR